MTRISWTNHIKYLLKESSFYHAWKSCSPRPHLKFYIYTLGNNVTIQVYMLLWFLTLRPVHQNTITFVPFVKKVSKPLCGTHGYMVFLVI